MILKSMLTKGGKRLELSKVKNKILDYGTLVMFSHTIFSLSFALI